MYYTLTTQFTSSPDTQLLKTFAIRFLRKFEKKESFVTSGISVNADGSISLVCVFSKLRDCNTHLPRDHVVEHGKVFLNLSLNCIKNDIDIIFGICNKTEVIPNLISPENL